ncbi:hypothetical protein WDW37_06645 [Bdellovibrionota bacterium FG-1]
MDSYDSGSHFGDATQHFHQDGSSPSVSFKNLFGGHDHYDSHGNLAHHSEANVLGGKNVFDGHHNLSEMSVHVDHAGSSVMHFSDPLSHAHQYAFPEFKF